MQNYRNALFQVAAFFALIAVAAPAPAAIYKCEWRGNVIYSSQACPGGKVMDLREVARNNPPLSPSIIKQQVERDRKEAERLEKERRVREVQEEREQQQIAVLGNLAENKCLALALRKRLAAEDATLAGGYAMDAETGEVMRHARHISQRYDAECGE